MGNRAAALPLEDSVPKAVDAVVFHPVLRDGGLRII
jgi:hypothetical protein